MHNQETITGMGDIPCYASFVMHEITHDTIETSDTNDTNDTSDTNDMNLIGSILR